MSHSVVAIINPNAGAGAGGRAMARVSRLLGARFGAVEIRVTHAPGDAVAIAREVAENKARAVISVGGDGTHHEVLQGLMAVAERPPLGVLHAGSGGDFRRNLTGEGFRESLAQMEPDTTTLIDVGHAAFVTDAGEAKTEWFLNVASTGISGDVVRRANRSSKMLGGQVSFAVASLRALAAHRARMYRVVADGESVFEGPAHLVLAGNGRWAGGGMQFVPEARLDDGLLDLLVAGGDERLRVLAALGRVYSGGHQRMPEMVFRKAREIVVMSDDPGPLELDGESPGRAPVTFRVEPKAIALMGRLR